MYMFPIVELIRLEEDFDYGTFGILRINKQVFCATLELPDLLNKKNKSSIPAQQYECKRIISPKFGNTFTVCNVPDRTHILFHAGNVKADTAGCILLGQYPDKLKFQRSILNSGNTFKLFMNELKDFDSFHLTIYEHY